MFKFIFTLILFTCSWAYAAVFMNTDSNGMVVYSDTPQQGAKPVSVQNENIISTPELKINTTPQPPVGSKQTSTTSQYEIFNFIAPTDQASIQNQAQININFDLKPALQRNDQIIVFLDGREMGRLTSGTQFMLPEPDRGSHQLYAAIVDASGRTIQKTNVITIFVHRVNQNFRPR